MNKTFYSMCLAALLPLTGCDESKTLQGQEAALDSLQTAAVSKSEEASLASVASPALIGKRLVAEALPWENQEFRVGKAEQCMNWTREILVAACGEHFATLETQDPWDKHLLGPEDKLLPEHVDSLAADEFGQKITAIDALEPGDLVFLKNTYGDWAEGVLTHVGIALGDGRYIHRMTSNDGLVKINAIPAEDFDSGIRLKDSLCHIQ